MRAAWSPLDEIDKGVLFSFERSNVSLAQLVEQLTLNQWVESSSLSGDTKVQEFSLRFLLVSAAHRIKVVPCTAFPPYGVLAD